MLKRPDCHTELRLCGQHNNIGWQLVPVHNSQGGKRSTCESSQKYEFDKERGVAVTSHSTWLLETWWLLDGNKAMHNRI